jgi:hypothetical protein
VLRPLILLYGVVVVAGVVVVMRVLVKVRAAVPVAVTARNWHWPLHRETRLRTSLVPVVQKAWQLGAMTERMALPGGTPLLQGAHILRMVVPREYI